jgi:hypothetical protein
MWARRPRRRQRGGRDARVRPRGRVRRGLDFYNNWGEAQGWPLSRLLLEARRRFPGKRLAIGETGNCHFSDCHTVGGWLELVAGQIEQANAREYTG